MAVKVREKNGSPLDQLAQLSFHLSRARGRSSTS